MALGAVLAAALTDHSAHPFGLYAGGLDLITTDDRYGVDVTTISLHEAGPDAVSSLSFTVRDATSQVPVFREGTSVQFRDLANDWDLFLGIVETVELNPGYGGAGRDITVTCVGVEIWLDWAVINKDRVSFNLDINAEIAALFNNQANGGVYVDMLTSPIRCLIDQSGASGSTQALPTAPGYDIPSGFQDVQLDVVVPAGTTVREAIRQLVAAHFEKIDAAGTRAGLEVYTTVDFTMGLRMWNGNGTRFGGYSYQAPDDYPTLTITDTVAGTHAVADLSYTIDYGDKVHDVYVKGASAAGSGFFSISHGLRARQAVITADSTDATGAASAAAAYFSSRLTGTRGSLTIADWAPDNDYRAGSLLVISDANVGLSGETFRIFDIEKSFLSTGRQTWRISFGGPRPSAARLVRRLTRSTLD